MENIPLPSDVTITPRDSAHSAVITIEPFFPGYGTTIGNSLRRIMLSSLPGAALTSFSVKGIQHEFSTLPHVKEDFVEITLNLKQVRLKVHSPTPVRLHLHAHGERKVTAGDIAGSSEIEIANPEQGIATLTDPAANLEMTLIARQGRGYEPTEAREKEELEVGMIAIDALFSPVRKVGFQVENVRVGQMTNWDKLILEIETDGTISPQEAITLSTRYLAEHLGVISDKLEPPAVGAPETTPDAAPPPAPAAGETNDEADAVPAAAEANADAEKPKKKPRKTAATA